MSCQSQQGPCRTKNLFFWSQLHQNRVGIVGPSERLLLAYSVEKHSLESIDFLVRFLSQPICSV